MRDRLKQIGFSQRIRLEWLEFVSSLVLAGKDKESINSELQQYLEEKLSVGGKAVRGNREKAITILMKIWFNPPQELQSFQKKGLELLQILPMEDHIAIHWGMSMAVYPFWSAVASSTGTLLRLQGIAAAANVQRRVRERYGERDTVSRAARRVLRAFMDWNVLNETSKKGVYGKGLSKEVSSPELIGWMIEALLWTSESKSGDIRALLDSPAFFPFQLEKMSASYLAATSSKLEIVRHGLNDELIVLK